MQEDFLKRLFEEIQLNVRAQKRALSVLQSEEKALHLAVSSPEEQAIRICTRRLFFHRKNGAAFCLAFCLLQAEKAYAVYQERGIPDRVYFDTMRDIAIWTDTLYREEGIVGLAEIQWLKESLYGRLFRIGRLQYQFYETNYRWNGLSRMAHLPIADGRPVLQLHIPQDGPLFKADCVQSIAEAAAFFATYFPSFIYDGLVCESWLLDEHLVPLLPQTSNILAFRTLFSTVVQTSAPFSELTRRLWGKQTLSKRKIRRFPETTTLQKQAKAHLLSGGKTGNGYGFLGKGERPFSD